MEDIINSALNIKGSELMNNKIKTISEFDFYKPVKCSCGKNFKLGIKVGKIHDGSCPHCGREYEIVGNDEAIILRPKSGGEEASGE